MDTIIVSTGNMDVQACRAQGNDEVVVHVNVGLYYNNRGGPEQPVDKVPVHFTSPKYLQDTTAEVRPALKIPASGVGNTSDGGKLGTLLIMALKVPDGMTQDELCEKIGGGLLKVEGFEVNIDPSKNNPPTWP
jgi:hypothetical protein